MYVGVGKEEKRMIEVGKYLTLKVLRMKDFGVYLGEEEEEEAVLLPRKQVPEHTKVGDTIEVFVYRDSRDRKIATTNRPYLTVGEIGVLKVVSVAGIGAFMDCGLERDILLPFKEQTTRVAEGESYPVYMYVDKSDRLCVTMRLYQHLDMNSPYKKNDMVRGIVYEYKDHMGAFILVEGKYSGLVPKKELYQKVSVGEEIEGRIMNVREDGKLDISLRKVAYVQMNEDAGRIEQRMDELGGILPFTDKASPEKIKEEFGMSKNEFKRAVGHLLKAGKIEITDQEIHKK